MTMSLANMNKAIQTKRLIGAKIDGNRHKDDFYATPPEATRALLSVETFKGLIWEPACGDGAISRVLQERYPVVSTDLVDRGFGPSGQDFLMQTRVVDNIITNPPFKLATEFIRKSLDLARYKVCMLLKIGFLEGVTRKDILENGPLKTVYVFSNRQTFLRGGSEPVKMNGAGGMICYAWFVWDHEYKGPTTIGWLDTRKQSKQPTLLDDYDAAKDSWNNYNTALGAMRCRRKGVSDE